jgi:hypothetical protein
MTTDTILKRFNFLSWLTAIVLLLYIVPAIFAFNKKTITWQVFSGAVGPLAGVLLGYWVKGLQE